MFNFVVLRVVERKDIIWSGRLISIVFVRPQFSQEVFRGRGARGAIETVLQSGALYGQEFAMLSRTRISFPTSQLPSGIAFVLQSKSEVRKYRE